MIKEIRSKLIFMMLSLVLFSCMSSLPKDPPQVQKTYKNKMNIRIMGARRSYLVHVPPALEANDPRPLVVVIHGAFDTATGMETISGFSKLADSEGFVVLYPNGMGLFGFLQHWNAGHCCGKALDDDIDDVGFVAPGYCRYSKPIAH